jgi:hypothetical protein
MPLSFAAATDDPLLASLANNGGPTLTHALLTNSPAFGLGSNLLSFTADQRGTTNSRTFLGRIDIGAFEMQSVVGPVPPGDYNRNHSVDAADYVVWRKTVGNTVAQFTGADGNGNLQIDSMDYLVWRSQFGITDTSSAPTIDLVANSPAIETEPPPIASANELTNRNAARFFPFVPTPNSLSTPRQVANADGDITMQARQTALELLADQRGNLSPATSSFSSAPHSEPDNGPRNSDCLVAAVHASILPEWT